MKFQKHGQEEMVGFVLIVILIVVIGLIFLAFSLKKDNKAGEDAEVKSLLESMLAYTTNCSAFEPEFYSYKDLAIACYNEEYCNTIEQDSCQYLQALSSQILDSVVQINDAPITSYELKLNAETEKQEGFERKPKLEELVSVNKGVCNGTAHGSQQLLPLPSGVIKIELKMCYQ